MDTKLKKSKPVVVWLSFFMAVNIIVLILITGLGVVIHTGGDLKVLKAPFSDYENTIFFKERTSNYFNSLFYLAANFSPDNTNPEDQFSSEGDNLKYCAVNRTTGLIVKNIEGTLSFSGSQMPVLPDGYSYFWYFDGQKVQVIKDGQPVDVKRLDSGYRDIYPNPDSYSANPDIRVVLAVKDTIEPNPYGYSMYDFDRKFLGIIGWVYIAFSILGLSLLAFYIVRRQDKKEFDRSLASWSGRIWLEVKAFVSLIAFIGLIATLNISRNWNDPFYGVLSITVLGCALLLVFWWFYLMLIDLWANRKRFFTNNVINSVINSITKWYQEHENRYPWQKAMRNRVYLLVAVESVLALMSVMFLVISSGSGGFFSFLIALMLAGAGIYILYRYLRHYNNAITDLGQLVDHIALIKAGDMKTRLELPVGADMYQAAQDLNSIQEGMSIAVAEKTKSERMKVELITNVSHDLKTPLTSIISYVDLLAKEEGLPEHVNDYIKILAQKSERLKNLIQDLFDLSKASSDTIALDMEKIDLARLVKQSLADMEEQINDSGLTFKLNIPEEPVFILSDGKKLSRVWENLISNALKYSLLGSRVFIDLSVDGQAATATIKNTANYEMNFSEEEILQRFVRGDESRTSEGSGLGLSIAQSFTQICGGKFSIKIDGDLFKVELKFNTI